MIPIDRFGSRVEFLSQHVAEDNVGALFRHQPSLRRALPTRPARNERYLADKSMGHGREVYVAVVMGGARRPKRAPLAPSNERHRLPELAAVFLRLGATAFGGPAAHLVLMRDEFVTRRGWLNDADYVDLLGVTNLIPGPNSTEMAMHIGYRRAGWRGLAVAGTCFILPAACLVTLLAWLYVEYGTKPAAEWILVGVAAVTVVIVFHALLRLLPTAAPGWVTRCLAALVVALYLLGVNELVLLFGAGATAVIARTTAPSRARMLFPLGLLGFASDSDGLREASLARLAVVFLKAGALLYGSGYVLFAFLHNDLVERLEVLTEQQLLDAAAIGQVTPGPVFTSATFIGYLLHGFAGAMVATIAIFLPAYILVAAIGPIARRMRNNRVAGAFLDGVNAGALGLMAGVTVVLAGESLDHWLALLIAASALVLLLRTKLNSAWLIAGAGALSWAAGAIGMM